jgi:hypothetical protein
MDVTEKASMEKSFADFDKKNVVPTDTLLKLSKMEYPMIQPLSLVNQHRLMPYDCTSSTITAGNTFHVLLATGDDWVWGKGCYLKMDVTWTTQSGEYGPLGSAANIIQEISIYHSSGHLIDRIDYVNLMHMVMQRTTKTTEHFTTNALNWGCGSGTADYKDVAASTFSHCIPLSDLHGLWNTDKLIPSFLHSGIKLVIKTASSALVNEGTAGGTYALANVKVYCDQRTLTDAAQDVMARQSATKGLVFPFISHEAVAVADTAASYNIQVNRPVSLAVDSVTIGRDTALLVDGSDSFLPINITKTATTATTTYATSSLDKSDTFSVGWKLGSQIFPVRNLTNVNDLYVWNRQNCPAPDVPASYKLFDVLNTGVFWCSLERDSALRLQGLPTSGSRPLVVNLTYGESSNRTINVFLRFVKLARSYMYDRVIIQE